MIVVKGRGTGAVYTHFAALHKRLVTGYSLGRVPLSKRVITRSAQLHQTGHKREPPRAYTHTARRKKLPCRNCLSWVVKLCKLLNQNLSSQETGSDERQSKFLTYSRAGQVFFLFYFYFLFFIFIFILFCFFASVGRFLKNNPLSTKTAYKKIK